MKSELIALLLMTVTMSSTTAFANPNAQPIPRGTGESCPYGYYSSGSYCTPSSEKSNHALPRGEHMQCPYGYYPSGNACLAANQKSREAIPRVGQCPYGYYASGDYCLKSSGR
ncbi:MAG: hypothetical protein ACK5GN_02910 [Pseudomonadota bacterium]|jgi:hypothetical protein